MHYIIGSYISYETLFFLFDQTVTYINAGKEKRLGPRPCLDKRNRRRVGFKGLFSQSIGFSVLGTRDEPEMDRGKLKERRSMS